MTAHELAAFEALRSRPYRKRTLAENRRLEEMQKQCDHTRPDGGQAYHMAVVHDCIEYSLCSICGRLPKAVEDYYFGSPYHFGIRRRK